jgi:6-phosphofructokinase 1
MGRKRIGILTGGGDVPGLNSVIKSVVYRGHEHGLDVVGIRRGFEGLTHLDLDSAASRARFIMELDRENCRTIDRTGGTVLHTSRTGPTKVRHLPPHLVGKDLAATEGPHGTTYDLTPQVLKNLDRLGIDSLLCIGGDGTITSAAHLASQGVKVIAIPKTMDNDVQHTEYCIGFSTAITRASDAIERQRGGRGEPWSQAPDRAVQAARAGPAPLASGRERRSPRAMRPPPRGGLAVRSIAIPDLFVRP